MKIDLTGVKGAIASILIILSLIIGALNAAPGALQNNVETLGASNFDVLQTGDGSVSEPAFGFTSDPDNGLYRIGTNNIGIVAGGVKVLDATASGVSIVGTFAPSGLLNANGGIAVDTSNFTVDGTTGAVSTAAGLTSLSADIGGGFGSTGCTLSSTGVLQCNGAATIGGAATITGALTQIGASTFTGASAMNGGLTLDTNAFSVADTTGNTVISGTATITGALTQIGTATVTGATALNGGLSLDTNAFTVADTTGNTVISGTATITGALTQIGAATVTGATALNGGLTMDTSAFSVADTTGNTQISGTLDVTSTATFNDSVYANAYLRASDGTVYVFDGFRVRQETALDGNVAVSGTLNTSTTLGISGVTFTGPVKYGTSSTYTSGSSITHGFTITPTCILQPTRDVTSTLTITATGFSSDMASVSEPIYWMCGQ